MSRSAFEKDGRWKIKRAALYLGMAVMLSSALTNLASPTTVAAAPQPTCRVMNSNEVCGRFLQEWSKFGSDQAGVYVNGLPITQSRPEISLADGRTYDTQWFERARYESHPENKAPYDVLLGRLGASLVEGRGIVDPYTKKVRNPADQAFVGIDKPADVDGKSKVWFAETRHSVSGKILEYWNRYGGLQQFGFPLSEQFQEISQADGKTYTVQYFERNRFELHPEKQAPYEVELGLLGVQQYQLAAASADSLPIAPPKGVKSSKDTLVIGSSVEPSTVNDDTALLRGVYNALFAELVGYDDKNNVFPQLVWYVPEVENGGAQFVGTGDDRHLQLKYKMRPGQRWSDGVEITSADVAFGYKASFDPDFSSSYFELDRIYNIDNPDKYTILVNYLSYSQARDRYTKDPDRWSDLKDFVDQKRAVADFYYPRAMEGLVLPEHRLGQISPKDWVAKGYYSDPNLVVTDGPFKLEKWDRGRQLSLVPNPYYNLTAPPLLKRIIWRFVPDRSQLLSQLRSGDIDVVMTPEFTFPDKDVQQMQQMGLTVVNLPAAVWEHIEINLDKPYFKEKTVRQAMLYAINRQRIVDQISLGYFHVTNTFVPASVWSSLENPSFPADLKKKYPLKQYNYDPATANKMLDEAGWVRGPDGIRSKNGVKLSFNYETTGATTSFRGQVQTLVQADLKAVGIDAKPQNLRNPDFFGPDGVLTLRTFDFSEFAWINEPDPLPAFYYSKNIPSAANGYSGSNDSGYSNPRFDEIYNQAWFELNVSKRAPLMAEMQSIYSEDLPTLPLFTRATIEVHNPRLANWDPSPWFITATFKAAAIYFK